MRWEVEGEAERCLYETEGEGVRWWCFLKRKGLEEGRGGAVGLEVGGSSGTEAILEGSIGVVVQ